jgi:MOSC domain-containing protein YiiM
MGEIVAVCLSAKRGVQKETAPQIELIAGHGIRGDGHAGEWHRQVSLLAQESADKMRGKGVDIHPGDFAENILTRGVDVAHLPIGTHLRIGGGVLLEVTQIGKECHEGCAIRELAGDCVMPREGVFCRVLAPGTIRPGDSIDVISDGSDSS